MKIKKSSVLAMTVAAILIVGATAGTVSAFASNANIQDKKEPETTNYTSIIAQSISSEEQARVDKMKSDPFAPFEIYAQYGLSYDRATDTFYYDGKTVLFFDDQVFDDRYVSFTRSVGEIGLRAVRNEKYELTGLRIADNDLFERRRASIDFAGIAESVSEVSINTINSDKAYSIADEQPSGNNTTGKTYANSIYSDPNYVDDTLNGYLNYGVSYDNNEKLWLYKNRPIRVFYDKGITTYIDGSENAVNGLLLNVVRDVSGKILDLAEMTPDEVRSFGIYLPSK